MLSNYLEDTQIISDDTELHSWKGGHMVIVKNKD